MEPKAHLLKAGVALFFHFPTRTVQAIATYANVQMNYARGGDTLASMALQSTDACISQKGQQTDQAAERMLVLLPKQTDKWHPAQRGQRTLSI
jgi:hypothetical protein